LLAAKLEQSKESLENLFCCVEEEIDCNDRQLSIDFFCISAQ
jgi:hypothetical protein